MIKEKLKKLKKGELKVEDNIKSFLSNIKKDKTNSFIQVNPDALKEAKKLDKKKKRGKLFGLAIGVKSNICVKGLLASCASKTLSNYYAPYDADVIKKIKEEDGIIIGMLNCDEFAAGATGEYSYYKPVKNPNDLSRISGGSSSGPAASVKNNLCDLSLGSDTGGSIRNPASHCGVVGIKPSYGRVSRYGLIDLSMSLDQIGPLSNDVYGAALLLEVIAGRSRNDTTTFNRKVENYSSNLEKLPKLALGVSEELNSLVKDKVILEKFNEAVEKLKKQFKVKKVKLKNVDLAVQTYYPLVYVEFFSATRKFDGRKYGYRIEETCGEEVLRRILGGREISKAEYEGKYYRKALTVKNIINKEIHEAFKNVDLILSPVVPSLPHKFSEKITDPKVIYAYDALTIPANLAGVCAGSINIGEHNKIPIGMQVMAPEFSEGLMFRFMKRIEDEN